MERLTYRDQNGRAMLTHYGKQMYCSTQATADCFCKLEERLEPQKAKNIVSTAVSGIGKCPICDVELDTAFIPEERHTKFCYNCGQAVKWDE